MSIFSHAKKVVINDGQIVASQTTNIRNGPTGIDVLRKASSKEAAHDSSARDLAPRCFPQTREQYIEDVVNWAIPALGSDSPRPVFWMKGPAGVGKSAVAQTCSEIIQNERKLGATFFFSINGPNKPARFFTTIAYQLSTRFPDYHDLLDTKVRNDETLVDKVMTSQFRELILEPLQELERSGKGIGKRIPIFVDGLDECEGEEAQCAIVNIVAKAAREGTAPLCWAFFSRPEPHIEATFAKADIAPLCHVMTLPISRDADGDIKLYLRSGFDNILQHHNISMESPWPSESDIQRLVDAADGLFVYIATLLRFISQNCSLGPEEPLRAVLAMISNRTRPSNISESPLAKLHDFYMLILRRIPADMLPSVQLLLAILRQEYLKTPASMILVGNVLRLSRVQLQTICNRLSAVLRVLDENYVLKLDHDIDGGESCYAAATYGSWAPGGLKDAILCKLGGKISFYHKSFKDFLVDADPLDIFGSRPSEMNRILFEHFHKLQFDHDQTFNLQDSRLVLAPHVPDSAFSLSYPHTSEFTNSAIKITVYDVASRACSRITKSPELDSALLQKYSHTDFRKQLFSDPARKHVLSGWFYPFLSVAGHGKLDPIHSRYVPGSIEFETSLKDFDVIEFKKIIERYQEAGVLRPYSPNLVSRLRTLFRNKSESGLYVAGHGPKSIYWYWKTNDTIQRLGEVYTASSAEAKRIYRKGVFDQWWSQLEDLEKSKVSKEQCKQDMDYPESAGSASSRGIVVDAGGPPVALALAKCDGGLGLGMESEGLSGPSMSSTVAATSSSSGLKIPALQPNKSSPSVGVLSSGAKISLRE